MCVCVCVTSWPISTGPVEKWLGLAKVKQCYSRWFTLLAVEHLGFFQGGVSQLSLSQTETEALTQLCHQGRNHPSDVSNLLLVQ